MAMTIPSETEKSRTPREFDESTGDRVEKKPKDNESPRQDHDNEDQG